MGGTDLIDEIQKFDRRLRIVEKKIEVSITTRAKREQKKWTWFRDMLDWFGSEGMSSDESDVEDGYPGARVKTLPWRRDISYYLDYIDQHRFDGTVYSNRGPKPMPRTRRRYVESTRKAVSGLPRSFYDRNWLSKGGKDQAAVLAKLSKESFEWIDIVA